jgi:hypothetical protein
MPSLPTAGCAAVLRFSDLSSWAVTWFAGMKNAPSNNMYLSMVQSPCGPRPSCHLNSGITSTLARGFSRQ